MGFAKGKGKGKKGYGVRKGDWQDKWSSWNTQSNQSWGKQRWSDRPKGKGKGKGGKKGEKKLSEKDLDAELDEFMGPDAKKSQLDKELDTFLKE